MNSIRRSLLIAPLVFSASAASAVTLNLNPVADTYVRADNAATTSGGTANPLLVGQLSATSAMHALFSFDLSSVPVDATINSVSLVISQPSEDASSNVTTLTIELHLLTEAFIESQASWTNRVTGTAWSTAGGSFDSTVLSTASIRTRPSQAPVLALPVDHTWASTASFVSAVQSAADSGSNSIGFLLKDAVEGNAARELVRLSSRESGSAPLLVIDYTVASIPEPSAAAALAGGVMLAGAVSRRRRSA